MRGGKRLAPRVIALASDMRPREKDSLLDRNDRQVSFPPLIILKICTLPRI